MIKNIIEISSQELPSLELVADLVQDDSAGAISTFSGTTRDEFEGKAYTHTRTAKHFKVSFNLIFHKKARKLLS